MIMKIALFFTVIFLFVVNLCAQSRTISKDEYDKAFRFAVTKTNADYPLIFKVKTSIIENGKIVRTETDVNENEAAGRYRIKRSVLVDGRETNKYQLTVGYGNVFCSDDGVNWKSSKYECPKYIRIYGRREAEGVEYSVTEKNVDGKRVKVYREYSVFAPSEAGKAKTYEEKISTMDSRGYFINIIGTEGTLDPKTVTLIREQSWITQAKIAPVVAPQ
jgi:hypothetical protein